MLLALAGCTALSLVFANGFVGSDSWLGLLSGRTIVHDGLPHTDALTVWANGRVWTDQQWLAHVLIYAVFQFGGLPLLVLGAVALTIGAVAALVLLGRRESGSTLVAAVVALPLFLLVLPSSVVRAQTLAYPLFAAVVWLLWRAHDRPSPRRIVLTLPLLVLWANIHGSAVLGAGLVSLRAAELLARERRARMLPLVIAPWLALVVSPYALELPAYYRRVLFNPSFGNVVTEWQAPTIRQQPLFFIIALLAVALVASRYRRFAPSELIAFGALTFSGFLATRNIVWAALFMLLLLPRTLARRDDQPAADRHSRMNLALLSIAALVVALLAVSTATRPEDSLAASYSSSARRALAQVATAHPYATIWADERFADWLLFTLPSTRGRVLFDARFELLSDAQLTSISHFRFHVGPTWAAGVGGARLLVVGRDTAETLRALIACRGGRILYADSSLLVASLSGPARRAHRPSC